MSLSNKLKQKQYIKKRLFNVSNILSLNYQICSLEKLNSKHNSSSVYKTSTTVWSNVSNISPCA